MKLTTNDLKQERQWCATVGMKKEQFYTLLKPFTEDYLDTYQTELAKRKVDVNVKYCIQNEEELLLFTLFSLKSGLTYDVIGVVCGMNASNVKRNQQIGLTILKKTLKRLGHMPLRNLLNKNEFEELFSNETDVIIDVTEQPIQRPGDNKEQKEYYSGKKKAHVKNDCDNNNIKSY